MLIDRLIDGIAKTQNPTVVGLDPQLGFIPDHIKTEAFKKNGETLEGLAEAFFEFNKVIIDSVCDIIPAVKPQIAMYEQLGVSGIKCYIDTVSYAKQKGLIVIGDIKRSDIASTAEHYSNGHIGEVVVGANIFKPYDSDFITVNPYLGEDSITPFLKDCKKFDRGLFILVKTSNPGGGLFQDLISEGKKLYEIVGSFVEKTGLELLGKYGYSNIGAVVGATYPNQQEELRAIMPHTFFLIPGYGAQGATAKDIATAFDSKGQGAIVNSSRGIISAWKLDKYKDNFPVNEFGAAARQAALDMKDDLGKYVKISQ